MDSNYLAETRGITKYSSPRAKNYTTPAPNLPDELATELAEFLAASVHVHPDVLASLWARARPHLPADFRAELVQFAREAAASASLDCAREV